MSKTISLKKNTIANYIGQFYTMFIGIFMLPFYLEYLGAEAYGLVGFFTMLSAWMMSLGRWKYLRRSNGGWRVSSEGTPSYVPPSRSLPR